MKRCCMAVLAGFALLFSACQKEEIDSSDTTLAFSIRMDEPDRKSILENESTDTGFYVMVFGHDSGNLEGCFTFNERTGSSVVLRKNVAYDFYVVGNMWYLSGSEKKTAKDAGVSTRSAMEALTYKFDGGTVGGLKTETFAQFATYGIPYAGSLKNKSFTGDGSVEITAGYLFAKVNVTVDHSGLVNGNVATDVFKNSNLYVRGANKCVVPFGTNVKASSSGDLLNVSDYSDSMENGASKTFVYYVPENAQGTASVSDPSQKTPDMKALATYIEFSTVVDGTDGTAGGYGGKVKYQFCLGANATTDFNVLRNTEYNVTLTFKAGSLFSPNWKIGVDGSWNDSRKIRFSADAAGAASSILKSDGTQILAVRKNRPGTCYVYFNRSGADGTNERAGYTDYLTSAQVASYNPANVSRSGISLDYDSSVLSQYGMSLAYDTSTGKITVSYNPASAGAGNFLNVPPEGIPVTLKLHPGNKEVTALVRTYDDLKVDITSGDRYVGMKTVVTPSGFVGSGISVSANNGAVTPGVFRTTNAPASGTTSTEGTDNYLGTTPVACPATGLDLYAYRPTASSTGSSTVTLTVTSSDSFNDGTQTKTFAVYKPTLTMDQSSYFIPIDGTEVDLQYSYRDRNNAKMAGGADGSGVFDPQVYAQLMDPQMTFTDGATAKASLYCSTNPEGVKTEGGPYTPAQIFAKDLPLTTSGTQPTSDTSLGTVKVSGRNATLFSSVSADLKFRYPKAKTSFPSKTYSNIYNIDNIDTYNSSGKIDITATYDGAGCRSPFGTPHDIAGQADWYTVDIGKDYVFYPSGEPSYYFIDNGDLFIYAENPESSNATAHWYIKPCIGDNNSIYAPWGKRTVKARFQNMHSGRIYDINLGTFELYYNTIELSRFCTYPVYDSKRKYSDANCYVCCNLSGVLHTGGRLDPAKIMDLNSLPIAGEHYTNYSYDFPEVVVGSGSSVSIYLRYVAWSLRGWSGILWHGQNPMDSGYDGIYWEENMTQEAIRTQAGLLINCYFYYGSTTVRENTLRWQSYSGDSETKKKDMQRYVPIHVNNSPTTIRSIMY